MAGRFLLDQNFPKPPFDVELLDHHVRYDHLSDVAPHLAKVQTPDWIVVVFAEAANFDGLVTRDISQLDDPDTLVALMRTHLWVLTWERKPIEDPVAEWGQMIAYASETRRLIEGSDKPRIIRLPNPRLDSKNTLRADKRFGDLAKRWKTPYNSLRDDSLTRMRNQLVERDLEELVSVLDSG